ncbi:hypothetical protein E5F05_20530 [Deinococcus metallilatus]|uniref:Uncharacterized protein n=1 Tax=Deinococcus metallilatus TaxID=1211322 RepID=A0AAJ5F1F5_9DEIO|nr:hypothetical protein [Deinococcus metallilatus]MBB5297341.1 hypothetical protein [Deinococcus metallilatus]QBY10118.1 hypothetical protein E5F05_20530 [Deinococcus metallilatus]RXJ08278.1 hypothetical protein ERJ73_19370 [Deinococcus metallilatus]TLK21185.1 hypothetical protein FCS05_19405 [Deinococcus metallilatus]GMA17094.1 hypothetical protein GCM10025871_34250 [Deinococcus metallilatus]
MRHFLLPLWLTSAALAGGGGGDWHSVHPDGTLTPAGALRPPRPCPPLRLPADWDVRSQVYADVTGDGTPECVLAVWRPWRDWPITRWVASPSPITRNRDARGDSAHVLVLKPRPDGTFRNVWGGSALYQPVTALTVLPDGHLVTLEGTYARGRAAPAVALTEWTWTGFGFRLERRRALTAREVGVDASGLPAVR